MQIVKSIINFFKFISKRMQQSELELYIESKKPSSVSDVERLTREFHRRQMFRNFA